MLDGLDSVRGRLETSLADFELPELRPAIQQGIVIIDQWPGYTARDSLREIATNSRCGPKDDSRHLTADRERCDDDGASRLTPSHHQRLVDVLAHHR